MPEDHRLGSVARRLAATQRVMVVEDEHDIADFLRAYFRASGYDLVHIDPDTPLAVLEALDAQEPDCILLDLNLRGFSGAEAYRLLRTDPRYALLPVIIVSARPDAQELVPNTGGIDAFVTKPFNVNTLAELVMERITSAAELREAAAADDVTGLLGHGYVEARLLDELTVAAPGRPAAFVLVRLRSLSEITTAVGSEGSNYVARELVRRARTLLPRDAALGLTRSDELAIVLPGATADEAAGLLQGAIDAIGTSFRLPGGADVPLRYAVGVAAYPEHAGDADSLYMAADNALADAVASDAVLVVSI
ncbi:MAG: response regulator [Acidimicrobiales bacterium]